MSQDLYIYCSNEDNAYGLSRSIYNMARPPSVRSPTDVTELYAEPVEHPVSHEWRLRMLAEGIFIHPRCNVYELDSFMEPYIQQGLMTQEELDFFHQEVIAGKGGSISGVDVLPTIFVATALTYQQMVDQGWFPEQE